MPTYNRGKCACCETTKTPVSFEFVTLSMRYQYSQSGSTWYTDCTLLAMTVDVTYSDGSVERTDAMGLTTYQTHYMSNIRHTDNEGNLTIDGLSARWRVVFGVPSDVYDYTATLSDATSTETYPFQ